MLINLRTHFSFLAKQKTRFDNHFSTNLISHAGDFIIIRSENAQSDLSDIDYPLGFDEIYKRVLYQLFIEADKFLLDVNTTNTPYFYLLYTPKTGYYQDEFLTEEKYVEHSDKSVMIDKLSMFTVLSPPTGK